jgi:hypothetical protein
VWRRGWRALLVVQLDTGVPRRFRIPGASSTLSVAGDDAAKIVKRSTHVGVEALFCFRELSGLLGAAVVQARRLEVGIEYAGL